MHSRARGTGHHSKSNPTTVQGGGTMAKGPSRFTGQNTEEAMQATNYGMNWMRELAEQNLNQSRVFLESLLTVGRKAVEDVDQQASEFRHRSMLLAEETISNAFDFAHKAVRA